MRSIRNGFDSSTFVLCQSTKIVQHYMFSPKVSLTGVAINHDGRAATITAPNGTAQQRVLRSALAERQTLGEDVTMIECHGTGDGCCFSHPPIRMIG